jgi:mRNA interferase RelE/StbE
MAIYLSGTVVGSLGELPVDDRIRILGVLERIRIKPQSYLRKLIKDPSYRLKMEGFRLYLDLSEDDIIILLLKKDR